MVKSQSRCEFKIEVDTVCEICFHSPWMSLMNQSQLLYVSICCQRYEICFLDILSHTHMSFF